jgi:hypothetical protein
MSEHECVQKDNVKKIFGLLQEGPPEPGILQSLARIVECLSKWEEPIDGLIKEKIGRDAIKNNFMENLKKSGHYFTVLFGLSTLFFAYLAYGPKSPPPVTAPSITITDIRKVVREEIEGAVPNNAEEPVLRGGEAFKFKNQTKAQKKETIKDMNK